MMTRSNVIRVDSRARELNDKAIRCILLVGVLDYALLDVIEACEREGIYRFRVKRDLNEASRVVMRSHGWLHTLIGSRSAEARREFDDMRDENWFRVSGELLDGSLSRSYSLAMSLCRLLDSLSRELIGSYSYFSTIKFRHLIDLLSCVCADDVHFDDEVDLIIKRDIKNEA